MDNFEGSGRIKLKRGSQNLESNTRARMMTMEGLDMITTSKSNEKSNSL